MRYGTQLLRRATRGDGGGATRDTGVTSREDLVRSIVAAGVRDPRVLEALRAVPRAGFVPPEVADLAYLDRPLPIPHEQVTTQPSLSAKMIEALDLTGSSASSRSAPATASRRPCSRASPAPSTAWSASRRRRNRAEKPEPSQDGERRSRRGDGARAPRARPIRRDPRLRGLHLRPTAPRGAARPGRPTRPADGLGRRGGSGPLREGEVELVRLRTVTGAHFVRLYGAHAFPDR